MFKSRNRDSSLARFSMPIVGAAGLDLPSASVASTRIDNADLVATMCAIYEQKDVEADQGKMVNPDLLYP